MSEIKTIKVIYKPGKYEMVINESDFDEKIHEKAKAPASNKQGKKDTDEEKLKALIGEE